jgi:hypothetical protein
LRHERRSALERLRDRAWREGGDISTGRPPTPKNIMPRLFPSGALLGLPAVAAGCWGFGDLPLAGGGAGHHTAGPMVMTCYGFISLGSRLFPTSVLTRTIRPSVSGPTSISQPSGQLMQTYSRPTQQRSPPAQTCIQPVQPCGLPMEACSQPVEACSQPVEASGFLVQSS